MFKKVVSLLAAIVILFSMNIIVFAEDYVFTDREGKQQVVPDGEYSFVTRVVEFVPGKPWTKDENCTNRKEHSPWHFLIN